VFYLLSDQLQSTSAIATQAGVEAARQYYYPYGGNRGGSAFSDLTTRRFTGQYHEAGLPDAEGPTPPRRRDSATAIRAEKKRALWLFPLPLRDHVVGAKHHLCAASAPLR
jgi:hypothetical protein